MYLNVGSVKFKNRTWFGNVETHSSRLLSDVRVVEVAQTATHLTKFDESSTRIQPCCVAPGAGGDFEFVKVVKGHLHLDAACLQLRAIFSVRSLLPIVGSPRYSGLVASNAG